MVSIYGLNERIGNRSYYDSRGDQMFTDRIPKRPRASLMRR